MKNIEDKTLREFIDDVIRYYAKKFFNVVY